VGGVGFSFRSGAILAVTDRADISSVGTQTDQVLAYGRGALFAEGEVVLGGSANVGVAGDDDLGVGIVTEVVGEFVELRPLLGLDGEAVVGKVDGFAFEGFVVGGVRIAGTLGQRLILNIIGGITESGGITFFVFISASGETGDYGYKE
jgi:hypothetical protein